MQYLVLTTPQDLKSLISEVLTDHFKKRENTVNQIEKGRETQKKYHSRAETAEQLGITLPTLDKYTKKGIIESHRIGNRVLYKDQDIEKAIVNRKF